MDDESFIAYNVNDMRLAYSNLILDSKSERLYVVQMPVFME